MQAELKVLLQLTLGNGLIVSVILDVADWDPSLRVTVYVVVTAGVTWGACWLDENAGGLEDHAYAYPAGLPPAGVAMSWAVCP